MNLADETSWNFMFLLSQTQPIKFVDFIIYTSIIQHYWRQSLSCTVKINMFFFIQLQKDWDLIWILLYCFSVAQRSAMSGPTKNTKWETSLGIRQEKGVLQPLFGFQIPYSYMIQIRYGLLMCRGSEKRIICAPLAFTIDQPVSVTWLWPYNVLTNVNHFYTLRL